MRYLWGITEEQREFKFRAVYLKDLLTFNGIMILTIVFIGQFLNWWLESLKFRALISKTESINQVGCC